MKDKSRKEVGRIGLSMAINYFTLQGYTVSLPINDTQWYDLIVEKNGVFKTVQCKATSTETDAISLRSTGGTCGKVYDNIFNHSSLDYLFCVNKNLYMWLIPVKDIPNNSSIVLRLQPAKNKQGFQTYLYIVFNTEIEREIFQKSNETSAKEDTKHSSHIHKIPLETKNTNREELKQLIRAKSFTEIGRMFNVSDNAIRKWCIKFNLPSKKSEIKKYSDEEWKNV